MTVKDELYSAMLDSPLGVTGADQTLSALSELLRELRTEKFWQGKPARHLSEEQMIRAWASYRRDLRELRERLRQRQQDWDELLSWLAMFLIEHYSDLARTSAIHEQKYQIAFDMTWLNMTPEEALAIRDDWQAWVVVWLRDALRDTDLDVGPSSASGNKGGCSDEGDSMPDFRPSPSPDSDNGLEF